jgi:hypothetical protein
LDLLQLVSFIAQTVNESSFVQVFEYPFGNTTVFAIGRPHESAVFVVVKTFDELDLRFAGFGFCSHLMPLTKIVSHVIATEGKDDHEAVNPK